MSNEVSDPETLTIQLLRDSRGRWFNINLGVVDSISLATIITDEVFTMIGPLAEHGWTAVKFTEVPF